MYTENAYERILSRRLLPNLSSRNSFSLHLRLFLIYFFLISLSEALAQCKVEQRSHAMEQLSDVDIATFANQTDLRAIYHLLGPILVERVVGTPAHREVGNYLERTLRAYGFKTEWDAFEAFTTPEHGNLKFRNLIATFNPEIPRRLVLACHYDSKYFKNFVFKAATDSALPCALLLDLARTLSLVLNKRKNKDVTLQLVFFDGEEAFGEWSDTDSVYGARHLANKWNSSLCLNYDRSDLSVETELSQMEALVLLDLLGTRYPYPEIQSTYGHGTERLFERLVETEIQLRRMSKLRRIPQIFRKGIRYASVDDDHRPFMKRGAPVVHIIPYPFPVVWHLPTDDESALDDDVIFNLATIFRVFVARYFGVRPAYITDFVEK